MQSFNMHQAKTHFSQIVDAAMSGQVIIIAKAGKPVAKLSPLTAKKTRCRFGVLRGKIKIASDFDAPLPDSIIASFEDG